MARKAADKPNPAAYLAKRIKDCERELIALLKRYQCAIQTQPLFDQQGRLIRIDNHVVPLNGHQEK